MAVPLLPLEGAGQWLLSGLCLEPGQKGVGGGRSPQLQGLVQVEEGNDLGGQRSAHEEQARTVLPQLSGASGEWILKGAKRPSGKWIPHKSTLLREDLKKHKDHCRKPKTLQGPAPCPRVNPHSERDILV